MVIFMSSHYPQHVTFIRRCMHDRIMIRLVDDVGGEFPWRHVFPATGYDMHGEAHPSFDVSIMNRTNDECGRACFMCDNGPSVTAANVAFVQYNKPYWLREVRLGCVDSV